MEATAADSFADIFALSKLGIAMAAMIKIIATTINSSINENPTCLVRLLFPLAWREQIIFSSKSPLQEPSSRGHTQSLNQHAFTVPNFDSIQTNTLIHAHSLPCVALF